LTTVQFADVTATTDSNGYFDFTFDNHIDAVVAGGNSPQSGQDVGVVGVSAVVTGDKSVKVRVWVTTASPDSWSVRAAASKQVEVTLIGLSV
jgi:hypothetical protein